MTGSISPSVRMYSRHDARHPLVKKHLPRKKSFFVRRGNSQIVDPSAPSNSQGIFERGHSGLVISELSVIEKHQPRSENQLEWFLEVVLASQHEK